MKSPTMLLTFGLAAIGLAIAIMAWVVLSARARQQVVARALSDIDTIYSARAPQDPSAADSFAAMASWLRRLGQRLSPPGLRSSLQHRLDLAGQMQIIICVPSPHGFGFPAGFELLQCVLSHRLKHR